MYSVTYETKMTAKDMLGEVLNVGDYIVAPFNRKNQLDLRFGKVLDILVDGTARVRWDKFSPGAVEPKKPTTFDATTGKYIILDGLRLNDDGTPLPTYQVFSGSGAVALGGSFAEDGGD